MMKGVALLEQVPTPQMVEISFIAVAACVVDTVLNDASVCATIDPCDLLSCAMLVAKLDHGAKQVADDVRIFCVNQARPARKSKALRFIIAARPDEPKYVKQLAEMVNIERLSANQRNDTELPCPICLSDCLIPVVCTPCGASSAPLANLRLRIALCVANALLQRSQDPPSTPPSTTSTDCSGTSTMAPLCSTISSLLRTTPRHSNASWPRLRRWSNPMRIPTFYFSHQWSHHLIHLMSSSFTDSTNSMTSSYPHKSGRFSRLNAEHGWTVIVLVPRNVATCGSLFEESN